MKRTNGLGSLRLAIVHLARKIGLAPFYYHNYKCVISKIQNNASFFAFIPVDSTMLSRYSCKAIAIKSGAFPEVHQRTVPRNKDAATPFNIILLAREYRS